MPEEIKAWNCSFRKFGCKKPPYRRIHNALKHENRWCFYNPENKTCYTCEKYTQETWNESGSFPVPLCKKTAEEKADIFCTNYCKGKLGNGCCPLNCDDAYGEPGWDGDNVLSSGCSKLSRLCDATAGCQDHILANKYKEDLDNAEETKAT